MPGLTLHLRNAIGYGATQEELMEVLEIASVIGIHAATTAAPIVLDELQATGLPPDTGLGIPRQRAFIEPEG